MKWGVVGVSSFILLTSSFSCVRYPTGPPPRVDQTELFRTQDGYIQMREHYEGEPDGVWHYPSVRPD